MSGWCQASVHRIVSVSRRAQGLPERVEDPAALAAVASLLHSARKSPMVPGGHQDQPAAGHATAS